MPHSFIKIWIHAIWATKERNPLIRATVEKKVYDTMYNELVSTGCRVRIINGMPDHIHILFSLSPQKSVADVIKQVKGSTSHFINEQNLIPEKFLWQTGYAAYSVSESQLEKVYQYIKNQKQHHLKNTFQNEFDAFLKLHNLQNENET